MRLLRQLKSFGLPLIAALPLMALVACGSDAQPAEVESTESASENGNPMAEIPLEELYGASPAENLWTPRIELEVLNVPAGWSGARIAIISDFQLGRWPGNEEVAVAAVQRAVLEDPDLIVLIGDFIAEGDDTASLERVLAPLRGRAVLGVLGEADVRSDSLAARITSTLANAGVQLLRNTATGIAMNGDTAWVAGLDPELLEMTGADQQYVVNTLGVPGRTPILLTATPGLAARVQDDRFPIVIAGGAFCGEVAVPGATTIASLRENIFPGAIVEGADRLFRMEGTTVLLSCGIGYGFVPLRFGSPPEVPILTITSGPQAVQPDSIDVPEDSLLQQLEQPGTDSL